MQNDAFHATPRERAVSDRVARLFPGVFVSTPGIPAQAFLNVTRERDAECYNVSLDIRCIEDLNQPARSRPPTTRREEACQVPVSRSSYASLWICDVILDRIARLSEDNVHL